MNSMKKNILRIGNAIRPAIILQIWMILCLGALAWGQVSEVSNVTSTPVNGSGHDYIQSLNETVNPANGSVSLRLSMPTPGGRGISLPFSIAYDSNGLNFLANVGASTPAWLASGKGDFSLGGWSYSLPLLSEVHGASSDDASCTYWDNFIFHDPIGGLHALNVALAQKFSARGGGATCSTNSQLESGSDDVFQAVLNGSSYFDGDPPPAMIAGPDGTTYYYSSNFFVRGNKLRPTAEPSGFIALPDYIVDRNGNQIAVDNAPPSTSFSFTDTLGRTLIAGSGFAGDGDTVSISGLSQPYTLHWGTTPNSKTSGYPVVLTALESFCGKGFNDPAPSFHNVVTSIVLPNGQSYRFEYDPTYGLLNKVTYPSGAYVSYTWGFNQQSDAGHFLVGANFTACDYRYGSPAVASRFVSLDGQSIALRQDFSYSTTWFAPSSISWTAKTTTVTTSDLASGTSFSTVYTYSPLPPTGPVNNPNFASGSIPVEKTVQHYADINTSGTPLRTEVKSWFAPNRLACELNILDDGQISGTFYKYTLFTPFLMTDKKEYDYGAITDSSVCQAINEPPAGATHEVQTSYQSFAHAPFPVLLSGTIPIFEGTVFAYQPSATITKDGGGATVAETDYGYDQAPLLPTQNLTGHDYVGYGASYNVRGNPTTITRKCFPACSDLVTTYTYDDTGQKRSMADFLGHTTSYDYDSTNAYLAHITSAVPDPTGVHGSSSALKTSTTYDFSTGLLLSSTDENGNQTTYSYSDPFNRMTSMTLPGGGGTTIIYQDQAVAGVTSQHELRKLDAGRSVEAYSYFDGLGHEIRSVELDGSGSAPWIATDTFYDGLGRVSAVSNPYRIAAPAADRTVCGTCTASAYDSLGRVISVTTPDNARMLTSYHGNVTSQSDEAATTSSITHNALGNITSVIENPTNKNAEASPVTTYSYSSLGDLVSVSQGSQQRFFMYDSLGRIIRERNVEEDANPSLALADPLTGNQSWSTSYAYDSAGNLTTKTDARGIVTTTSYDGLNRETIKTYSNDPLNTPAVEHFWDGAGSAVAVSNVLGKITAVTSGSSTYRYDGYSSDGYVLKATQILDNISYPVQYAYDLAGHVTSETYPSGRVVSMGTDAAGRVNSISGQPFVNGAMGTPVTYADSITYAAHGGISALRLGNGLWEHTNYDANRLQVAEIGVGMAAGTSDILKLGYDYGTTNNNGNILRQVLTAPVLPGQTMVATQLARYDAFNRLTSSQEASGDISQWQSNAVWEQDLTYDQYGNRTGVTTTSGLPTFSAAAPVDSATNRFASGNGFAYDPAGNLIQEPVAPGITNSYTYDAESRIAIAGQNGTTVAAYQYDGLGRRVKKIQGSDATVYVYDLGGDLIAEYSTILPAGGLRYLTADSLGSTRLITAKDGSIAARYDWMPFGELIPAGFGLRLSVPGYGPAGDTTQLFTGKERDAETGLDNFTARYFSSPQGRFTSPDEILADQRPGDPQAWNLYAYVRNNPLGAIDPSGKVCVVRPDGSTYDDPSLGGQSCAEVDDENSELEPSVTVTLDRDELNLLMLQTVGENLSSPTNWADLGAHGYGNAALIMSIWEAPGDIMELWKGVKAWRLSVRMARIRNMGKLGEELAGIVKNTERIPAASGAKKFRIPDVLDHAKKIIGEVKNLNGKQALTSQIKDDLAYANAHPGYTVVIYKGPNTTFTGPLQALIDSGKIKVVPFPK